MSMGLRMCSGASLILPDNRKCRRWCGLSAFSASPAGWLRRTNNSKSQSETVATGIQSSGVQSSRRQRSEIQSSEIQSSGIQSSRRQRSGIQNHSAKGTWRCGQVRKAAVGWESHPRVGRPRAGSGSQSGCLVGLDPADLAVRSTTPSFSLDATRVRRTWSPLPARRARRVEERPVFRFASSAACFRKGALWRATTPLMVYGEKRALRA